jgi:hypothetical protein
MARQELDIRKFMLVESRFKNLAEEALAQEIDRIKKNPQKLSEAIIKSIEDYQNRTKNDPCSVKNISPARAGALFVQYEYVTQLEEVSLLAQWGSLPLMGDVLKGVAAISRAVLAAEESYFRGVDYQTALEIKRNSPQKISEQSYEQERKSNFIRLSRLARDGTGLRVALGELSDIKDLSEKAKGYGDLAVVGARFATVAFGRASIRARRELGCKDVFDSSSDF